MSIRCRLFALSLFGSTVVLASCAKSPAMTAVPAAVVPHTQATMAKSLPPVLVHKSPTCGCCGLWVAHLRQAGFVVQVDDREDVNPVKQRLGVPYGKGSCHTAEVGGYFVEGHVPAEDIKRLLAERPDAKGLVLPGMPAGSPGMELPDGTTQPYTVELIGRNGEARSFSHH